MSSSPATGRRLAVVTGAASGMGLATARQLADGGTAVVGVDLDGEPDQLSGDTAAWVRGDIAEPSTWDRVAGVAAEIDPAGADCLVCCAAAITVKPFLDTRPEDFRRLFEINVLGVIRGLRTLLPPMVALGRGAVAVVCSVDSLFAEEEMSAYAASKAALLQVVRSAALEHARDGLQINAVLPGAVDTPLLRQHLAHSPDPADALTQCERRSPQGRLLRPEEVARTLCFLVSPGASGLSGAAITVDGGLTSTYDFTGP
ncbi:SDR family NAD(P)-dependent oxidoreductase [Pseudonocardia acaciae]|uniref:SDR family NAD(P)-dependent oxidoreductase n=1 Tax=Pseudonocardia acaciae TaxID=551276 RepID=UPI000A02F500|nr:SDR family oxidoreductase [Pseudonocardia acaciae]